MSTSASGSIDVSRPRDLVTPIQVVAWTYAAWLFALTFVSQGRGSVVIQEIVLLAGVVPALLQTAMLPSDTRGTASGLWFMVAFVMVFLASLLANDTGWVDLANVINVIFVFMIGFVVASCGDTSLIRRVLARYALLTAPYLLYINLFGAYEWGRLKAGSQPNLWGLIALNVAVGALCVRNRLLAGACWAVVLLTMYNAQTRGSMVALAPVVGVAGYMWWRYSREMDLSWKVLAVIAALLVAMLVLVAQPDFFINNIMRLNDPYRGLQSGMTGRDTAWDEALRIWYGSPILGVGFRRHEYFMVFTELNAHNAYLAMLADAGILGLTVYAVMIVMSFFAALRLGGDHRIRLLIVAILLCYGLVGMFERRAINVGNSFSIVFIFACLIALRLSRVPMAATLAQPLTAAPAVDAMVPAQRSVAPAVAPVVVFPVTDGTAPVYPAALSAVRQQAAPAAVDAATSTAGGRADAPPVANAHEIRAMIEYYLDVDAVARASLGRLARAVSDRQFREFRRLLRDMIAYSYAAHFSAYAPSNLQIGRMVAQEDGTGLVRTWVRRPDDGEIVAIDWRLGAGDDEGFKVLDVIIDGISVVRTLRADFTTIAADGGMPRLLSALRRQVEALKKPPRRPAPPPVVDRDVVELATAAPARRRSA